VLCGLKLKKQRKTKTKIKSATENQIPATQMEKRIYRKKVARPIVFGLGGQSSQFD